MRRAHVSSPGRAGVIYLLWVALTVCADAAGAPPQGPAPTAETPSNSLHMTFAHVPVGRYVRGFDNANRREHRFHLAHRYSNRQNFGWEQPSHQVAVTRPFDIGVTEVTVGQFRAFVAATGYATEAEQAGGALGCFPEEEDYVDRFHKAAEITWRSPGFTQTDDHPVVAVSWRDAVAFCRWLSETEQRKYRLPTEAEWEYACRAGTTTWYSWGESPDAAYTHANVADGALEAAQPGTTRYQRAVRLTADDGDGFVFTAPVQSFRANPWGLHDMHGNVWEWCFDRWSEQAYDEYLADVPRQRWADHLVVDPRREEKTDQHAYGDWRVLRGGAWTCAPAAVRCSIRTFAEAGDAAVYTGFRVVREVVREVDKPAP